MTDGVLTLTVNWKLLDTDLNNPVYEIVDRSRLSIFHLFIELIFNSLTYNRVIIIYNDIDMDICINKIF